MPQVTFTLKFKNDPENVQQIVDQLNSSVKSLGASVERAGEQGGKGLGFLDDQFATIGLRFQGFQSIFSTLSATFGKLISESNASEVSTASLAQALRQQGIYTEQAVQDFQDYAAQLQEVTGADGDLLVATMGQLTAMGLQGEELKKATSLALDLSVVMGTDVSSAARVMADAFSGNSGMLGRYVKGLDEADIKARGAVSIIEQLERAVGGQAKAFGDTGAGSIKKLEAALGDWREAMGDVLKSSLIPFVDGLASLVSVAKDLPPSLQVASLGVTAFAGVIALVGSSMGSLPYLLIGVVTGAGVLFNAIREGSPLISALAAGLGAVGVALLVVNANTLLASTTVTSIFIPALKTLQVALVSNPIFALIAALAALGGALYAFAQQANEANEELRDQARAAELARNGIQNLDEAFEKMSVEQAKKKLAEARQALVELELQLESLEAGRLNKQGILDYYFGGGEFSKQKAELEGKVSALEEVIVRSLKRIQEEAKKEITGEETYKRQLEAEKLRIAAMEEGVAKERAVRKQAYDEDIAALDERRKKNEISDEERNTLGSARYRLYQAELRKIDQESENDRRKILEKQSEDYAKYIQEIKDLDRELAIDLAKNDAEEYALRKSFLEKDVQDLLNLGVRTLDQEKQLAAARANLQRLSNDETRRLKQERDSIERELATLQTGDPEADGRRQIEALRRKYAAMRSLAEKYALDVSAISRAEATEENAIRKQQHDEAIRLWRDQHKLATVTANAISDGFGSMWDQLLLDHRQAKDEGDAIWLTMKNSALASLGRILQQQIENALVSLFSTTTTEEAKTAAVTKATVQQTAAIAAGAATQTAIAAETAGSAIAISSAMSGAIVAQMALISAVASTAATLVSIATFGGAAVTGGAAVLAALAATKAAAAIGFDKGGQIEEGETGFFEGRRTEIIAPKRTFIDIMREEIVPLVVRTTQSEEQRTAREDRRTEEIVSPRRTFVDIMREEVVPLLVRTTQIVTLQATPPPAVAYIPNNGSPEVLRELQGLRKDLQKKALAVSVNVPIDGRRVVRENLRSSERSLKVTEKT